MTVFFYDIDEIDNLNLEYSVICAAYRGNWILVRHRARNTWEIPGGHIEAGESALEAAKRELYEETGAIEFFIEPICDYSVERNESLSYGRLYYADIKKLGALELSEISEVKEFKRHPENLTYPLIMPFLIEKTIEYLKDKAMKILMSDRIRNVNIINFIKTYPVYFIGIKGKSVLIRGQSDEDWVYISATKDNFSEILPLINGDDTCFAVIDDWMVDSIVSGKDVMIFLSSIKFVYEGEPLKYHSKENIHKLTTDYAKYIYDNSKYQDVINIDYIADRIKNGIANGLFIDGVLVAWAITHDDGAIGFLTVLDSYRRKGYAYSITASVINTILENNEVPFVHIEETNQASLKLADKIGFKKERRVSWFKLKS